MSTSTGEEGGRAFFLRTMRFPFGSCEDTGVATWVMVGASTATASWAVMGTRREREVPGANGTNAEAGVASTLQVATRNVPFMIVL